MFIYDMKRIINSAAFWGSVFVLVAVMFLGCFEDLEAARANHLSVMYLFFVTTTVGITHVLIPAITIVPFMFCYLDEMQKGAIYYPLMRSSKKTYFSGIIFSALLSSAAVVLVSLILFTLICLAFGAGWEANASVIQFFKGDYFENMLEDSLGFVYIVHGIALILFSMPWAVVGIVISLFTTQKYLIVAGPFVFFMLFSYFTELLGVFWLNPGWTLLKGSVRTRIGGGIFHAFAYQLIFIIFLLLIYCLVWKRKLRYEGI